MLRFFSKALLGRKGADEQARVALPARAQKRARLEFTEEFPVVYAIGDVHGCLEKLIELERVIEVDAAATPGAKLIVRLGDYIDRGPKSSAVLDYLCQRRDDAELKRISILGNHELMLLDVLSGRMNASTWIDFGGDQTMRSYGIDFEYLTKDVGMSEADAIDEFRDAVPESHIEFLSSLPISVETPRQIFVHAGIRPGTPWEKQLDDDLLYIRAEFMGADLEEMTKTIVHGHTPGPATMLPKRIGIDTGAHLGGPLTAARIGRDGVELIQVH